MGVVSWIPVISLSGSGTIGHNEVELTTITFICVVFKANQGVRSTVFLQHLFDHCRTWELKHWLRTCKACRTWKPVISFAADFLHPLGYSSVKETVESLQLYPLVAFKAKLGNKDKELRTSNLRAKFLWSWGLKICPNVVHDLLLCSSIKTVRLGRYIHFYS